MNLNGEGSAGKWWRSAPFPSYGAGIAINTSAKGISGRMADIEMNNADGGAVYAL